MSLQLEKYSARPDRDTAHEADIQHLAQQWAEKMQLLQRYNQPISAELAEFAWQLEEIRMSLFAQKLKTPMPVSVKRLQKEWEKLVK